MVKSKIPLKKETKLRLIKYSNIYSSWDSVITELLDHVDQCDNYWVNRI